MAGVAVILLIVGAVGGYFGGTLTIEQPPPETITITKTPAVNTVTQTQVQTQTQTQVQTISKADTVKLVLDWIPQGAHVPYYVALDKGFFGDEGISATVQRGFGSTWVNKQVDIGDATFGYGDLATLMLQKEGEGISVTAVGLVFHKSPLVIVALKDSGITKPTDLEGKNVGVPLGGTTGVLLPAFAKLVDLNLDNVQLTNLAPYLLESALTSRKVDAILRFSVAVPGTEITASKADLELTVIPWSDYGFEMYTSSIVTADSTLANNPDLVKRFVKAVFRGIQYAIENPEESAEIFTTYIPQSSKELVLMEFQEMIKLMDPAISAGKTGTEIGIFDPELVELTKDLLVQYAGLETNRPIGEFYTNQFVQE